MVRADTPPRAYSLARWKDWHVTGIVDRYNGPVGARQHSHTFNNCAVCLAPSEVLQLH